MATGFGIGGNHFTHTMRRNVDLTYIVMDNQIYGLHHRPDFADEPQGDEDQKHSVRQRREPHQPHPARRLSAGRLTWRAVSAASRSNLVN